MIKLRCTVSSYILLDCFFPKHGGFYLGVFDRAQLRKKLFTLPKNILHLMYEIGRLVGEKTTTDKFPEAKKAAVRRSRSVLGGTFAEQLAPYLPNFPFSPTEAKFIGAPIDFLVFKGVDTPGAWRK